MLQGLYSIAEHNSWSNISWSDILHKNLYEQTCQYLIKNWKTKLLIGKSLL